jgi:hypothetical protein
LSSTSGATSSSTLKLAGKQIAKVEGTARLVTSSEGKARRLIATTPQNVVVKVQIGGRANAYKLNPDNAIEL